MNLESYNPLFCVDDGIFGFFSIRKASSKADGNFYGRTPMGVHPFSDCTIYY